MCENNIKNAILLSEGANGRILRKNNVAIKNKKIPDSVELDIQAALYKVVPEMIVKPLGLKLCQKDRMLYYMNYVPGASLYNSPWAWTDNTFRNVIVALIKIKQAYPSFRHNDLHLNNIMVTPEGRVYIIDFGFANIRDLYPNPKVMSGFDDYGIHEYNDTNYDYHLFLNSLWLLGVPELQKKIESVVPKEYLGMSETSKIKNMRLKLGVDTRNFPGVEKILKIFE